MINIIWDLDGTLIDSAKEVKQCLEVAVKKSGLDLSKQIKPFVIGPTIEKIIREAFPPEMITDEILNGTIKHFRRIYDNSDFEQTKPFLGIEEIVTDTINFTHHIVTNKPDMPTNRILDKINWSKYIASVNTPYTRNSLSDNKLQLKNELFRDVIDEHGGDISSFIGIGDMKSDCMAAKDNNITTVGVLWGTGTREELSYCCDHIFDNVKQLRGYLYGVIENRNV
jgi:phosphoglycolate phosphatase